MASKMGLERGWYRRRQSQGSLGSWSTFDWAWAAGLFEGEGTFCVGNRKRRTRLGTTSYPHVALVMADRDIVERFAEIIGIGNFGPARASQDQEMGRYWRWGGNGFEAFQATAALFWPWLGERRRAKIREVMQRYLSEYWTKRGAPSLQK